MVSAFGGRIKSALSGGYDSRLIAAGLLSLDCDPQLYVYGKPDDPDRRIASELAEKFQLNFRAVEKPQVTDPGVGYAAHIATKLVVYDGLYPEGLFDNAVDMPDRINRLGESDILLIGSGGEALRNFFYLPDGRYTPDQIVSTFYSGYDPSACTGAFDESAYRRAIAAQLAHDLGVDAELPMDRKFVEAAYPLFRVRYWSTREIAVNQRFGWTYYPYLDDQMIGGTASIPIRLKTHGRLEASMIRNLHPGMAAVNSDYGFNFASDPPLNYRVKMLATYLRPTGIRRYTYRVKNRRMQPRESWQNDNYLGRLIDLDLPGLKEHLNVAKLNDAQAYNRAATVEYLMRWHRDRRSEALG